MKAPTTETPVGAVPGLPPDLVALLSPALHPLCSALDPARGTRLFATGARPAHLFFIERGEAVLERPGLHGEVVVLQRTRRGFIGEASLQFERYHCDARVLTDAHITRLPVPAVRAALASDPAFASRWIGMLNREVRRLRLQCERLALHRVQDRVLHLLATEGEAGCYPVPGGLKSLAAELGVTHEALYRALAALEQAGRLKREDGVLRWVPLA
ncbi:MAG: Crp/Fnr family transcriptional regulator [Hydrogenophaga sp.]|uniref:Crp/Fnr family transcriptional regulator n=1 Tax=Hydrogenophaga sp. TaxID=1904254 RepID=UPI0027580FE0|nr:Crp/Fnr family transcriptional regulator [Hydrogenophaga sp.]MDP2416651.1 Crp/Fnr family transcriptional regulator [Hydrogenophaga sp.]MDZ4187765.1 Crp/Fnr family transcriptional regulator [Hydrogenophaga sp.]